MSDKELIKQEIERLINDKTDGKHVAKADITAPKRSAYLDILNFIDSLPEKPTDKANCTTKDEDLEEYYKKEFLPKEWFAKPGHRTISQFNLFTARHFAEWQKQQMMKDAVNGEVVYQIGSAEIAPTDIRYKVVSDRVYIPNVKLGDKVKIIVIKED